MTVAYLKFFNSSPGGVVVKGKVTIKNASDEKKVVPAKVYQDETVEL